MRTIKSYLSNVIEESVKSSLHHKAIQEKEKQASFSRTQQPSKKSEVEEDEDIDLFSDDNSEGGDEAPKANSKPKEKPEQATSSKTMDDETEKLKSGDIKSDDIVEKLNAIRSGRSFKDETISSAMEQYIDSLSKAEKTALLAFLKGISQIVTGEVGGEAAVEPEDKPSNVSMEKNNSKNSVSIQPNVIKMSAVNKSKSKAEDSSGPVPITPKKK